MGVGRRETAKKLERGACGLKLGPDRAQGLPVLPVGWSCDGRGICLEKGTGLAVGGEEVGRSSEESLVR